MPRPIFATVHQRALHQNLTLLRQKASQAQCFAVLKANAYGHGIERVYPALSSADGFAVLDLSEAECLRSVLGYLGPILLLEGIFEARDLEWCSRLHLWHTVHEERQINWLAAHKTQKAQHVFLKLNSGMNRLGFTPEQYRSAYAHLQTLSQVEKITHMLHFANADQPEGIEEAMQRFERACQDLPGQRSTCNSAGLLLHGEQTQVSGDWLRPGIALYGGSPDYPRHSAKHWGLQPAMSLRSRVIAVQKVRAGEGVGYGLTFSAPHDLSIGIVACGYADGYPRSAPSGTPVLLEGERTQLVARVSMDMLALDLRSLTKPPEQYLGAEVCLWGRSSSGKILGVDEVALAAQTIGYELLTAVTQRVPFAIE